MAHRWPVVVLWAAALGPWAAPARAEAVAPPSALVTDGPGTPSGETAAALAALHGLLAHHGFAAPARLPDLDAVAAELGRRLAGSAGGAVGADPQTAAAHLRFVLSRAAVGDAEVVPFVVPLRAPRAGPGEAPDATPGEVAAGAPGGWARHGAQVWAPLLARLDRQRPPTHLGLAWLPHAGGAPGPDRADAGTLAAVLVHRGLSLDAPLPEALPVGSRFRLAGDLRPGYFRPWVVVAPPGQPILQRPAWTESRRAEVNLYFDAGPGVYGVEVLAESQAGPVVLLNQRVYVGVAPPTRPTVVLRPEAGRGAHDLWARVDAWRTAAGLLPLQPHPDLSAAAVAHAAELARTGRLSHASADTGTLKTRLRARGLKPRLAAENLAEAADAGAAFAAFLDSPGHARNLLLPELTHGAAAVQGRFWVLTLAALPSDLRVETAPDSGPKPGPKPRPAPVPGR